MKRCTVNHMAAKYDDAVWALFRFFGVQETYDEDPTQPQQLEVRNCPGCGTTQSRPIKRGGQ